MRKPSRRTRRRSRVSPVAANAEAFREFARENPDLVPGGSVVAETWMRKHAQDL